MKSTNYKIGCLLLGVFCATSALADEFADRVVQANQAIATPAGARYDQLLMPYIQVSARTCAQQNSVDRANLEQFTLVGSVLGDGRVDAVRVQPQTAFSECFARQFAQSALPELRLNGVTSAPHPIVVNVKMAFGH